MDTPEATLHSFIVKLWLEDTGDEAKQKGWHGYITHVPSGERQYLRELTDIVIFIERYFESGSTPSLNRETGAE
jgi:hypothetical protein